MVKILWLFYEYIGSVIEGKNKAPALYNIFT